jgi:hypothetical protein
LRRARTDRLAHHFLGRRAGPTSCGSSSLPAPASCPNGTRWLAPERGACGGPPLHALERFSERLAGRAAPPGRSRSDWR